MNVAARHICAHISIDAYNNFSMHYAISLLDSTLVRLCSYTICSTMIAQRASHFILFTVGFFLLLNRLLNDMKECIQCCCCSARWTQSFFLLHIPLLFVFSNHLYSLYSTHTQTEIQSNTPYAYDAIQKKETTTTKSRALFTKILCFEHFVTKCVWYLITSSLLLLCFLHATIDAHSTKSRFETTKQSQCAMCSALFLNFS